MPRTDDSTAQAANWRTVLVADAVLGVLVCFAGVGLVLFANAVAGAVVVAAGLGYVVLVGARARRWSRLRRSAPR